MSLVVYRESAILNIGCQNVTKPHSGALNVENWSERLCCGGCSARRATAWGLQHSPSSGVAQAPNCIRVGKVVTGGQCLVPPWLGLANYITHTACPWNPAAPFPLRTLPFSLPALFFEASRSRVFLSILALFVVAVSA